VEARRRGLSVSSAGTAHDRQARGPRTRDQALAREQCAARRWYARSGQRLDARAGAV